MKKYLGVKIKATSAVGLIAFCLAFAVAAQADTSLVCQDLYRFSCAPGTYDDGTGTATTPNRYHSGTKDVMEKTTEEAKRLYREELEKKDNVYFRQLALSATGLSMAPDCQNAAESPNTTCLDKLAEGCADIAMKLINPDPQTIFSAGGNMASAGGANASNLSSMTLLMYNHDFTKVGKNIISYLSSQMDHNHIDEEIRKKIFPQIKDLLMEKVKSMIRDEALKKKLLAKIHNITFEGTNCAENAGTANVAATLTENNAFYNPGTNSFKYCLGRSIDNTSRFQVAMTVAHELSHSIDPCSITYGPTDWAFKYKSVMKDDQALAQYPIPGVLQCLRSKDSVQATIFSPYAQYGQYTQQGPYGTSTYGVPGATPLTAYPYPSTPTSYPTTDPYPIPSSYGTATVPTAPKSYNPTADFCSGTDQIDEAFADWMGDEILPDYIAKNYPHLTQEQLRLGYANVFRQDCGLPASDHPSTERRADYLLVMQPKIRKQMGCKDTLDGRTYCAVGASKKATTPANWIKPQPAKGTH